MNISPYRTSHAFTLVELMIVIAIIGILAAALFPSMSNYIARANNRALIEEMRRIGILANMDFNDFGNYAPDISPSDCQFHASFSGTRTPRFLMNGSYSLQKWKDLPKTLDPEYCFDWQNWDFRGPVYAGWASVDVISYGPRNGHKYIKRYCLYQGRFDANATQCQNIGID